MRRSWAAGRPHRRLVGDYNNVARSLGWPRPDRHAVRIGSPPGYGPTDADLDRLAAAGPPEAPSVTTRPAEAAEGADAVHTDVWASMGQEAEAEARRRAFEGFTVDDAGDGRAPPGAVFLHCLPAHRGEEVAAEVIDGPQQPGVAQAHNRMHAAGACSAGCSSERAAREPRR
jgi:ornithine carbamoyltransferase